MSKIYTSSDQTIGNTPVIELQHIQELYSLKAHIFAKVEAFNPCGSVKDRIAKAMIEDAEKNSVLKPNSVIIEASSGNTGIALASVGTAKGYKVIIVMPETMSIERRQLIKAHGAELYLTDGTKGMKGALEKVKELAETIPNSFVPGQFVNPANPRIHYETTGPELFNDTKASIDIFVAGVGTGGTISGAGRFLKEKIPAIEIVAVEPTDSAVLTTGVAGLHKIQGIGAGFIPETLDTQIYQQVITVTNDEAFEYAKLVGTHEGFVVGISSGASLFAAIKLAKKPENEGKNIVTIFPDTGERYLSTPLFNEVKT